MPSDRMIPGDDPIELRPVARLPSHLVAQGGEITLGCTITWRELIRWMTPIFVVGIAIGTALVAIICATI